MNGVESSQNPPMMVIGEYRWCYESLSSVVDGGIVLTSLILWAACVPMWDPISGVVPGWLNEIIFQIRIFSVDCLLLSSVAAWRFEYFPGMERTPRSGDN